MVQPSLRVFLFISILTLSLSPVFAQQQIQNHFQDLETEEVLPSLTCVTEEAHAHKMATDPQYRQNYLNTEAQIEAVIRKGIPTGQRSIYTIPLVVHVIHVGEPVGTGSNLSDANIYAAIQGLNDRYANIIGAGLNIEVDFCLATRDPDGCPTSGIIRVDGSGVFRYADDGIKFGSENCGANELDVKALSAWPVLDYYNVWVVNSVCTGNSGYAYYPSGDWWDGTVIEKNSMNYSSTTLAHELGHALNLRHTFHGDGDGTECPENINCTTDGDRVCDTPPHREDDCGTTNPCDDIENWNNSRYNYMSYCRPARQNARFTPEQKIRITAALQVAPRGNLLTSLACTPPNEVDTAAFTSPNTPLCIGDTRELTVDMPGGAFSVYSGPGEINGSILSPTGTQGNMIIEYAIEQNGCTVISRQYIFASRKQNTIITASDDLLVTPTFAESFQWVDCENNFEPFPSDTTSTFLAPYTGSFAVITMLNGCTDTSTCIQVDLTAVRDIFSSILQVYPNPTNGLLNIQLDQKYADVELTFQDIHGRTVHTSSYVDVNVVSMDISHFQQGIYMLSMLADDKRSVSRLCKL